MKNVYFFVIWFLIVNLIACRDNQTLDITPDLMASEVKVVVVTMFEIGEDEGDAAGEFQLWKEHQGLDVQYPFPQSHHDIFFNPQTGVLGIVTGMGTAKASSAIMALGLDSRFDLTHAYWLIAGIAGIDPEDAPIGSAVWANWLVDGDLAHEIDPREMPKEWSTGYFPLFTEKPYSKPNSNADTLSTNGEVYRLNPSLVDWAYKLTKHIKLTDNPQTRSLGKEYKNYPNTQLEPFVLKGDQLAASTFWHGQLLNQWANNWTKFWTNEQGNFVTSAMEDTGSYQSLNYLHRAGRVDKNRVLVLRTGSNYTMQPSGYTAAENLNRDNPSQGFAGMQLAIESAYRIGAPVVGEIVKHWEHHKFHYPYEVNPTHQEK